ncbi:glycosyl transferase family group 2-domain-containing protein [Vararia minispora EC-137]|uniref:Glycosyl transferase family group 2-domain-containing protein n=1 Tax=Vararia minispora EC-137 TaxID=1314806 RepID=A0ACB8QDM8_9AGAM|nr:glycosyl transferase family group 2-domain-containing protein [Vararia minispora EC-137]
MLTLHWLTRCVPGLSILLLISLITVMFSDVKSWFFLPLACVLMTYSVIIHVDTFIFAIRLPYALLHVNRGVMDALRRRGEKSTKQAASASQYRDDDRDETRAEDAGRAKLDVVGGQEGEVVHLIIVPNYMEDVSTLKSTLDVLASHPRARTQYEICLAMEQKEACASEKAAHLASLHEKSFRAVVPSYHPSGVPGEIAGKSANVAFAARMAMERHRAVPGKCEDLIFTVMDADTHLARDYFSEIRRLHYLHPHENRRTLYVCPIIFDRNAHRIPVFVRCADLLWAMAGISALVEPWPISIPTSVYSLPLVLAEEVNGWDADPNAIGEDMHMLLKCYFGTGGTITTRTVFSPASQCNVEGGGDTRIAKYIDTLGARYRQGLRHMWGALDTGFAVRSAFSRPVARVGLKHVLLLHLLWEAHFLPIHLTVLLIFSSIYTAITPPDAIHPYLAWVFWFTGLLRTLSFIGMNVALYFYDRYHATAVSTRAQDMARAALTDGFSYRPLKFQFLADRILFPVAGAIFGTVPAIQAEISHFWTDRLVYRVSAKPLFKMSA